VAGEKVGFPGALMEGSLARLNKKNKEWEDRYLLHYIDLLQCLAVRCNV